MTNISATAVRDLREKTGAGMMDCKKALVETNGDFEEAIQWLRKKGLSTAAKRAERSAVEGLVAAKVHENIGVVVEVNAETDFVARNEVFQKLVSNIANLALENSNLTSLKSALMPSGKTVSDEIIEHVATIGENINLRRLDALTVKEGCIASYVHNSIQQDLGKIAVIVAIESSADKSRLSQIGRQIAMHIAAAKPQSLDISSLDQTLISKEKEIFAEQSRASGKPENIIEKMVEGRIRKFFDEVVLLEQVFVIDGKTKISEVLTNAEKELGKPIKITGFVRYEVAESMM